MKEVEVNEKTVAGRKLLRFVKELAAPEKSVRVVKNGAHSYYKLTATEMVMPLSRKPSKEQLQEFFERDGGAPVSLVAARKSSIEKLKAHQKKSGNR